jgi:hypothetical protein
MVREFCRREFTAPVRGLSLFFASTQDFSPGLRPGLSSWAIVGRPFRGWGFVVLGLWFSGEVWLFSGAFWYEMILRFACPRTRRPGLRVCGSLLLWLLHFSDGKDLCGGAELFVVAVGDVVFDVEVFQQGESHVDLDGDVLR